ncbi:MAG TPA: hypothetical protein VKM72_27730 [Thermoanaerobaculia bacterium]|nr:hypothetical protein [Thermoanaerobaculia bacterium]
MSTGRRKEPRQGRATKEQPEPQLLSAALPGSRPGEWDDLQGLRETVLLWFPVELAAVFRWVMKKAAAYVLEKCRFGETPADAGATSQLRAAMLDLRFTARFLAYTAREVLEVTASSRSEETLGRLADELAVEVEKIADRVEARLARTRPGRRR